jgi:hypothetical protein
MLPVGVVTREPRTALASRLWLFSCGRQSCLQAAFQAAFSTCDEFHGFTAGCLRNTKPENTCELREWSGGGLKGRLQARLPATQAAACMPQTANAEWASCARLDKLKHVPRKKLEQLRDTRRELRYFDYGCSVEPISLSTPRIQNPNIRATDVVIVFKLSQHPAFQGAVWNDCSSGSCS